MFERRIDKKLVAEFNSRTVAAHQADLAALEAQLDRRGLKASAILRAASRFSIALPSWGFSQAGTRFGRFPAKQEPVTIEQKLFATALVNDLTGVTPRISLHIPWDTPERVGPVRKL